MKKRSIIILIISVFVMVLLPFLAVRLVPSDAGLSVVLLLFFVVNPLYSAVIGVIAGIKGKWEWLWVIVLPLIFTAGTFGVFGDFVLDFLFYTALYTAVCLAAALIAWVIKKLIK